MPLVAAAVGVAVPELEAVAAVGDAPVTWPPLPPLAVRLTVPLVTVAVSVEAVPAVPLPSVDARPKPTVPNV